MGLKKTYNFQEKIKFNDFKIVMWCNYQVKGNNS